MALRGRFGRIGSGKTYTQILVILQYLAAGRYVLTNISLNVEQIRKVLSERYGWDLRDEQIIICQSHEEMHRAHQILGKGQKGAPNLIAIDEAHMFFNTRDVSDNWKKAREFFELLTTSRHYFVDVDFLSQAIENLDAQIRRLLTGIYMYRDMRTLYWQILPFFKVRLPLPAIMEIRMDYDGKTINGREVHMLSKWVFGLYDSFDQHHVSGMASRPILANTPAQREKNRRRRIRMRLNIACTLAAGAACAWGEYNYYKNKGQLPSATLAPEPYLVGTEIRVPFVSSDYKGTTLSSVRLRTGERIAATHCARLTETNALLHDRKGRFFHFVDSPDNLRLAFLSDGRVVNVGPAFK